MWVQLDNMSIMSNMSNIMKTSAAPIDPILSALPAFDASALKNKFRAVTDQAAQGAIAITRYNRPELVILSAAEYVHLTKAQRAPLDALTAQFDEMVAQMQTAKSRKGVQAFLGASAVDLGKAAVKAAKGHAH